MESAAANGHPAIAAYREKRPPPLVVNLRLQRAWTVLHLDIQVSLLPVLCLLMLAAIVGMPLAAAGKGRLLIVTVARTVDSVFLQKNNAIGCLGPLPNGFSGTHSEK